LLHHGTEPVSVFHLMFWSDVTGLHSHPTAHYTDVIITDQQITLYQYHHSKTALYSITTAKLPYTLVTPQTNYHTSHVSTYLGLVRQFLFMLQCLFIFFFRSYGFHLGGEADSFLTHLVLLQSRVETQLNA